MASNSRQATTMTENLPKIDPLPTPPPVKDTTPEKIDASESDKDDAVVPTVPTVAPTLDEVPTLHFESVEPAVIPTATR